jgi:hypothetical protein
MSWTSDFLFPKGTAQGSEQVGILASLALSPGLIGKRKLERDSLLISHNSRDVALARRIFDQFDVPRSHRNLFPTRHFELALAAHRNHVLAAGRRMPVAHATRRRAMQFRSGNVHHLEDIIGREFGLDLFGMRLPVRPGVEPRYEQTFVFLNAIRLRACYHYNQAQQPGSD